MLPPRFAESPFARRAALHAGIPDERLEANDLQRPFHGVRMPTTLPLSLFWRCRAYQEWMNPQHCFSHQTAAALSGLDLPLYVTHTDLHVTAPFPLRAPESAGIVGHRMSGAASRTRDLVLGEPETGELVALTVSTPVALWVQLASVLDVDDLVALGDAIVTPLDRPGLLDDRVLATIDELHRAAEACHGQRGSRSMRRALPLIRSGSRSRPESLLRLMVERAGFPPPELNFDVYDDSGVLIGTGDLCWPQFRVVVEYEGDYHRRDVAKFRSDVTRGERYADAGWSELRAHADDVFDDVVGFMGRLSRRLRERGWVSRARELRQTRSPRR